MSQERHPCPGLGTRPCVGTGISRRDGACGPCQETCACGARKTARADQCADCKNAHAVRKPVCVDCKKPKQSPSGERCLACSNRRARGNAKKDWSGYGGFAVPVERRDHADPLARVLALEHGYGLVIGGAA